MKELSQEQVFNLTKNYANEIRTTNATYIGIPNFFKKYTNINFELLQEQAKNNGFYIKRACDINSNDEEYKKAWNEQQTVIVFLNEDEL